MDQIKIENCKKKKELEERMYLLRLKYKRLEIMQEELINDRRNEDGYKSLK